MSAPKADTPERPIVAHPVRYLGCDAAVERAAGDLIVAILYLEETISGQTLRLSLAPDEAREVAVNLLRLADEIEEES